MNWLNISTVMIAVLYAQRRHCEATELQKQSRAFIDVTYNLPLVYPCSTARFGRECRQ
jgi:hypothetical protein